MSHPPLLPSDRYLASLLGLTDEEYRWFRAEIRSRVKVEPGQPQAAVGVLAVVAVVSTLISVGLTIAASFFKPREAGRGPDIRSRNREGENITTNVRFAPRRGFDSVQEPAVLGTTVPLVYARRRTLSAQTLTLSGTYVLPPRPNGKYGGIRVAAPLIWSQLWSLNGSQLLRAIFLVSEGPIDSVDLQGFAIGDTSLTGYELASNDNQFARLSIYLSKDSGRLTNTDHIAGRQPTYDVANATNDGGQDVFALKNPEQYRQDFCFTSKPSANTVFGLHSHIPNNFSFRINPRVRPTITLKTVPKNDGEDFKVNCDDDAQALADTWKSKYHWSSRSGLIGTEIPNQTPGTLSWTTTAGSGTGAFNYGACTYSGTYALGETSASFNNVIKATILLNPNGIICGYPTGANIELTFLLNAQTGSTSTQTYALGWVAGHGIGNITGYSITVNWNGPGAENFSIDNGYPISGTLPPVFDAGGAAGGGNVAAGAELTYFMSAETNAKTEIKFNESNTDNKKKDADGIAKCGDVGTGVSARQRSADDTLEIGEIYKIGSAIAVLTGRSGNQAFTDPDKVFISKADSTDENEGQDMYYKFTALKAGNVGPLYSKTNDINYDHGPHKNSAGQLLPPEWVKPGRTELSALSGLRKFNTATKAAQIFRCSIANIVTPRACQVFELGIKSQVGIRVSGICNFRDSPTLRKVNDNAGYKFQGNTYDNDERLNTSIYQSGVIQTAEQRYSFFKIFYREYNGTFTEIPVSFGVRSMSSEPIFNYIRLAMPSIQRWELRFEPISGFEIRNGLVNEPLIVLDGRLKTEYKFDCGGGITAYLTGVQVPRVRQTFQFRALEPDKDIGYGFTDDEDMTDDWGRLAEAFAYDEIQTTASNGPEHEIVYINTITPNANSCIGSYENLAILGLNIRASTEWQQFSQFSCYITGGIRVRRLITNDVGPSDLFPDILRDLLTSGRYGTGAAVTDEQIDTTSFLNAATWCQDRRYFFNGALTQKVNLRQWAADTAAGMLLELSQRDGKWGLEPAVVFAGTGTTGKLPIKALFTSGNIVDGTFQMEFLEEQDRLPIQASVKWREERARETYTSNGLFPVEREVLIREAFRPDTDPIEQFDLSDWCTSREHAIDFACYVIRVRSLITHSIRFDTTPDGILTPLAAGDYIQVAQDLTYYDEYANGVVLDTGELVTTRPDILPPGTHNVTAWEGGETEIQDITLTVNANGTASPTGILFLKRSITSHLRTYKIESISINTEGVITIEAVHHPTDTDMKSEIGKNWTTYSSDNNWIIEDS